MDGQKDMFGAFEASERRLARLSSPQRQMEPDDGSTSARGFHESVHHQSDALSLLRNGTLLTDVTWKELHPGARLAPTIDKLRNANGLTILGNGSVRKPYYMPDRRQLPTRIETTEAIKQAYYESEHWQDLRMIRMQRDEYCCVLCGDADDLAVHHCVYNLFHERIWELMTVCDPCHKRIHEHARLAFPSGISVEHAKLLGFDPVFDEWLCVPEGLA